MNKKRQFINTFFALLCVVVFNKSTFAEPPNLSLLMDQIRKYHDTGAYQKELTHVIIQADDEMTQRANTNAHSAHPKKLAMVLDIDETSLSNYNKMLEHQFTYNKKQFHQDILAADAPVIKPMLLFFDNALKHGVTLFFITGRQESERLATVKNLTDAGYHNWSGLYMKPTHYNKASIMPFKIASRKTISKQGYTIIASIGDQESDLKGGYAEKTFKLPNPYYYLH
ncbi:MAG: HAD family acid phosphatase [Legionellales bacterium]|nr:HAD family acid phosphatase [Legionellales bacterium]